MSPRELERVEVMGRVGGGELKLRDAAAILWLSYRQVKRLWKRYQEMGSQGLQHGNVGRASNRSKAVKLRRRVLRLIKQKYSGSEEERFGPTLSAEHLAEGSALPCRRRHGLSLVPALRSNGSAPGRGSATTSKRGHF